MVVLFFFFGGKRIHAHRAVLAVQSPLFLGYGIPRPEDPPGVFELDLQRVVTNENDWKRLNAVSPEVIKELIRLSYSGRTVISGEEFSAQKFRDDLDNVTKILCIEDILENELTYQIGRAPSTAAWESSACPTCVPQQFFSGGHEAGAGRLHNHR